MLVTFSQKPFQFVSARNSPFICARRTGDCLECRYTQINFANAQQPAWEISRIRTRWYLARVSVQLPGITAKINDLLPARKLTTFLLYPLFFLHIRKLHKFNRKVSTRQILSTTCYISIRSQMPGLNKHMWKLSYSSFSSIFVRLRDARAR